MQHERLALALTLLLGTGCVSSGRYDDLKQREQELSWRCEVAERATLKAESEKRVIARELEIARQDSRTLQEKVSLANDTVRDTKQQCDEELKARLAELQSKAPSKQEITPWGGVVLESGVLFATGRSELTKSGETALSGIVEALTSPKYEGWLVELAGHTDSDPVKNTAKVYSDNHDLAARRANGVRRYLIAHGVPTSRLYLSAWGETRPLQTEATPDGKAANRRVEIRLHRDTECSLPASAKADQSDTKPASSPKSEPATEVPATLPAENAEKPAEAKPGATGPSSGEAGGEEARKAEPKKDEATKAGDEDD